MRIIMERDTDSNELMDNAGIQFGHLTVFLECLRYAQIVDIHRMDARGACFDIINTRKGVDTQVWASLNAKRMSSFGINAVAAPKWESGPVSESGL